MTSAEPSLLAAVSLPFSRNWPLTSRAWPATVARLSPACVLRVSTCVAAVSLPGRRTGLR